MAVSRVYSPSGWRTLEANGSSIASAAFVQADDADFSLAAHGNNYPHLEFELSWIHGTAPTAGSALALFAQDKNVYGGANSARAPSANNLQRLVATVATDAVTTQQYKRFDVLMAPADAAYWLYGSGITNAVTAGWQLRARAFTFEG